MTEHDGALDPLAERLLVEELAVGDHQIRSEPRAAGDLGEQGITRFACQLLGRRSGIGTGDHDGARSLRQFDRLPPESLGTRRGGEGPVDRLLEGRRSDGEGFAEGDVEVHRAGIGAVRTHGGAHRGERERLGGLRFGDPLGGVGRPGRVDVLRPAHGDAVEPVLLSGLVGADAAQLGRAVRRQDDERDARLVRFEHGRVEVGRRGAARGDDHRGCARLASEAEREEPADPLVDPHVQPDVAAVLEGGGDERQRLGP